MKNEIQEMIYALINIEKELLYHREKNQPIIIELKDMKILSMDVEKMILNLKKIKETLDK